MIHVSVPCRRTRGFSMIEVLVTLVVLLLGLLGLAGLMVQSQRSETESYQRVQALILVQDMVNRINANRKVASCYAVTPATDGSQYLGTGATVTISDCTSGSVSQNLVAKQDLEAWSSLLQGAGETSGTTKVGGLLGARGCISFDSGVYTVSIAWQGLGQTSAPSASWNCAQDGYGSESLGLRRIAATTFRIAAL